MSSPPYSSYSSNARSPPYPSHTQLPPLNVNIMTNKKRTSEGGAAPALKRRKPSAMSATSASSHPLRQTSFPPDESSYPGTPYGARSPSIDSASLVSGSQAAAAVSAGPVKKKRGRKSKADKAREQTPALTTVSGASDVGKGAKSARGGAGAEEEEEDREVVEVAATGQERTAEQKAEEHRLRGMLINAFTPEQFDRYENWRAAGLSKNAVKRVSSFRFGMFVRIRVLTPYLPTQLVNATVSQSVTEPVIIGVRSVAKVFIGDIIEGARRVQAEWAAKLGEKQTDLPTPEPSRRNSPGTNGTEMAGGDKLGDKPEDKPTEEKSEIRYGPLRPDHLREAMRRYRLSMEGGSVGMHGLWNLQQHNGVERFGIRTRGRRLFK